MLLHHRSDNFNFIEISCFSCYASILFSSLFEQNEQPNDDYRHFWTGANETQMSSLFKRTPLVQLLVLIFVVNSIIKPHNPHIVSPPVLPNCICLEIFLSLQCKGNRLTGSPVGDLYVSFQPAKKKPGQEALGDTFCELRDQTIHPFPSQSSPVHSTIC